MMKTGLTLPTKQVCKYLASDSTQFYGSVSRGFRSGGFNLRQNAGSVPGPYDEEVVDAFELGVKTDLADATFD